MKWVKIALVVLGCIGTLVGSTLIVVAETPDDRCAEAFPDAVFTDAEITTNGNWLICRVIEADLSERLTWVTRNGPIEEIGGENKR